MTTTSTELGLADALVRLSHLVQQVFGDVSHDHGLTPQQTQLLCMLIQGPVGMTELSRRLHLERSSLSGLVNRVEQRGLVTRLRDERDRRACKIALTGQGTDLAVNSHQGVKERLEELTGMLPAAERDGLASAVSRILAEDTITNGRLWQP